jgi:flagellar protein FlbD
MIKLTKLGGETFVLNADLIRYVEARPDTFITLTTGERLVVAEAMDEVLRRAVAYQQAKHLAPPPATAPGAAGHRPGQTTPAKESRSNSSPGADHRGEGKTLGMEESS